MFWSYRVFFLNIYILKKWVSRGILESSFLKLFLLFFFFLGEGVIIIIIIVFIYSFIFIFFLIIHSVIYFIWILKLVKINFRF